MKACLKRIAIGVVTDGSFGYDESLLREQIQKLTSAGRELSLHLYLLNGPAQRRYLYRAFNGFGTRMSPHRFRRLILYDKKFQKKYTAYVSTLAPVIREAVEAGVFVSISPMLEDNLSDAAFVKLMMLSKEALGLGGEVTWTRNPCPLCFSGNGKAIPTGVGHEYHAGSGSVPSHATVVSNDGWGFVYFKGDRVPHPASISLGYQTQYAISIDGLAHLRDEASKNNAVFLAWFSKYQGTPFRSYWSDPRRRAYPAPTDSELAQITEFLRGD